MQLVELERQLKQRLPLGPIPWGRKQTDRWDRATDFIYHTPHWQDLQQQIRYQPRTLQHYAINRWFSYWSAVGVELIFNQLSGVVPAHNPRDKEVDFYIRGVPFDHKTSVFPAGYPHSSLFAADHPAHLARWLYGHQSRERRFHQANRLFIILHDPAGHHWRLRASLGLIQNQVDRYVNGFDPDRLITLVLSQQKILTDIIWVPARPDSREMPVQMDLVNVAKAG